MVIMDRLTESDKRNLPDSEVLSVMLRCGNLAMSFKLFCQEINYIKLKSAEIEIGRLAVFPT